VSMLISPIRWYCNVSHSDKLAKGGLFFVFSRKSEKMTYYLSYLAKCRELTTFLYERLTVPFGSGPKKMAHGKHRVPKPDVGINVQRTRLAQW
jgi:hypothetical protein